MLTPFNKPVLPSAPSPQSQGADIYQESKKVQKLKQFRAVSWQTFYFGCGLLSAFLFRLIPQMRIVFVAAFLLSGGYWCLNSAKQDVPKLCLFAIGMGFLFGCWDAIWLFANTPILLPFGAVAVWQLVVSAIAVLVGAVVVGAVHLAMGGSNDKTAMGLPRVSRDPQNPFN